MTGSATAVPDARRLRALVVEDEWPTRNYLVELIEGTGLAEVVGAVPTLEEAREVLAGLVVNVVFADVQLAGKTGSARGSSSFDRPSKRGRAPMFVLATAYEVHALEAFELGVVDYLLKPFNEERVVQALRRLHERRPAVSTPPAATRSSLAGERAWSSSSRRRSGRSRRPTVWRSSTPPTGSSTSISRSPRSRPRSGARSCACTETGS